MSSSSLTQRFARSSQLTWTSSILSSSWRLNFRRTLVKTFSRRRTLNISKLWCVNLVSLSRFNICAMGFPMSERVFSFWCCVFIHIFHTSCDRFPDAGTIWTLTFHSVIPESSVGGRFTLIDAKLIIGFDFVTTRSSSRFDNWFEMAARKTKKSLCGTNGEDQMTLSNNQSNATLWVLDTCLIVGLLPLMIILITASLSSKMYSIATNWEDLTFEET